MTTPTAIDVKSEIGVFVLAKNEQANIATCLESLRRSGWPVIVLDSGSTDDTAKIVNGFEFAEFRNYSYRDHCTAYNEITTNLGQGYRYVLVLDADMAVSGALQRELKAVLAMAHRQPQVVVANIQMCVEGTPLRFGSLCPPKAFVFAVGRSYFVSRGHGEVLDGKLNIVRVREQLRHDDRKSYSSYLQSQERYSRSLMLRRAQGEISGKDRVRVSTPLLVVAVPCFSYFFKGGFLDGKAGLIYALDRLIAEAIMYRQSLSQGEGSGKSAGSSPNEL